MKKSGLFGFGIVMYGFGYLLIRHPKDFAFLLAHISHDYIFEGYRLVPSVRFVDTSLEDSIAAQSSALNSYLSFIPFFIGSIGFLKWRFGSGVRQDVCLFMRDIRDLFSDAGFVFENAPTKLQYRQSPGIGLKVLHFFDRPRNCFPSLHVILASYSYLKTRELINKYSIAQEVHPSENNFLFDWSVGIIGSCLLTKQHGLRDIAGGLAVVSSKCPQFNYQDMGEIINLILYDSPDISRDSLDLIRKEIISVYSELMASINKQNNDYRSVLVDYVRSI